MHTQFYNPRENVMIKLISVEALLFVQPLLLFSLSQKASELYYVL